MDRPPVVIYVKFDGASWKIDDLPVGVYPMTPISRTWKVHKATGISARRTGYTLMPDFASAAHMIQGATLDAVFCEMQHRASTFCNRAPQHYSPKDHPKGPMCCCENWKAPSHRSKPCANGRRPMTPTATPMYSKKASYVCHAICTKRVSTCTDRQYLAVPLPKRSSQCCIQKGSGAGACVAVTYNPNTLAAYVALRGTMGTITQSTLKTSYIKETL